MSMNTDHVLNPAKDCGLCDGGRGAPEQEALASHIVNIVKTLLRCRRIVNNKSSDNHFFS